MVNMTEDEYLAHIGIKRRSGRYPWGSGEDPYQRSVGFKSYLANMKSAGLSPTEIAQGIEAHINADRKEGEHFLPFKTTDLRAAIANSTEEIRNTNVSMATRLSQKGMSNTQIAERMGLTKKGESTVRGWLSNKDSVRENSIKTTAETLKRHVDAKEFLDVGKGTELYMGIANTKLQQAIASLKDEGYKVFPIKLPQLGTIHQTEYKVLTTAKHTWAEARDVVNKGILGFVTDRSDDGGQTYMRPNAIPKSVSSKRVEVRYKDDGGDKMDGVIELRRGIDDLSLGASNYAQVRIAVDKTHYLKGMAMYADDLPDGVDIRFNSAKTKAEAPRKIDAMKPMKVDKDKNIDPENPFGASTYPHMYKDASGKEKQSLLNIVGSHGSGNVEGRWDEWTRALSSQMLSKQPITLANKQLGLAKEARQKELDEINSLTNKVVKKKLLDEFADSADAAAVHLKAAALPRQTTAVILPVNSVKPHEIYAPNHEHGEKVVLVRHPHGGPFEIPELTVNNRNVQARRLLGAARDAVGIHHSVASQLSGADFDGDTVLVIPNNNRSVKTKSPLHGLVNFDAKEAYKIPKEDTKTVRMTKKNTQTEMGKISNLITDMSIHGANDDELTRAIKHSMVVIDAEKHGLNYKLSEKDNNIKQLKEKYQGINPKTGQPNGASTLISRASATIHVPELKQPSGARGVNPKTGAKILEPTNRLNQHGQPRNMSTTRMEIAKNARELLSDQKNPQPMEEVYAAHANSMKALADEARRIGHPENLQMPKQSKAARAVYANEVASLEAKLKIAQRNAPLERKAQSVGNAMAKARIDANPTADKDEVKKIKYQELERARLVTGAAKKKIGSDESPLLAREWEAIQAGAVSATRLREILANADIDRVRELATPKPRTTYLTPGQIARARSLTNSGKPLTEVAALLGIPRSTLSDNLANTS